MPIDYQPPRGIMLSDAIATTTGVADAGKVPKTNSSGLVDDTFLSNCFIKGTDTADSVPDGITNKAYTATEQSKLAGIEVGADVTDATNVAAAGAAMLAGQSGGQTLNGDTGSAGNLTLQSTAHATKGYINLDGAVQKKVTQATTTDATPATPFSLVVAENSTVCFEAKVLAKEANGMRACYFLRGGFYRNASGNVTQIGSTHATENETDAALDATLAATTGTQTIDVVVTGKAATTIVWDVVVNYFVN